MGGIYQDNAPGWVSIGVVPLPATVEGSSPKHPLVSDWRNATLEMVSGFIGEYPNAQIGILTGTGGIMTLDLDTKRPPANGVDTLKKWEVIHGKLPDTLTYRTPSGGLQMLYITDRKGLAHSSPIRNGKGVGSGVDVQADNKFAMIPPSVMPDGSHYEYINPGTLIATANASVYDFIAYVKQIDNEKQINLQEAISEEDVAILELENREYLKALQAIPCKDISRLEWIHVGNALKNIGVSVDVWDKWSSTDPDRYHSGECKQKWDGLNNNWNGASIISIAKKYGYNPRNTAKGMKLTSLSDIKKKSPEWFIQGYMPKGQINLIVGDGGIGKTSVTCSIMASASNGKPFFMDGLFVTTQRKPASVVYFSAEDSTEYVLKERLETNGANTDNIRTLSPELDEFSEIKFGSKALEQLISTYRPDLVVFDPIQQFIPSTVKMSERNAMRQCLAPLMVWGKKYGTTFIIVVHTNKRAGASGRNRMADSADIWDIARSVLIAGETKQEGIRYLSHEKSNYGPRKATVLFSIDDQKIIYRGTSDKHDVDYVVEADTRKRSAPERESAKNFVLEYLLREGRTAIIDLRKEANANGVTDKTFRNACEELIAENRIQRIREARKGKGAGVDWYLALKT